MIIIVPDLPPNVNGLGDYAYLLAKQLKVDLEDLKIDFIVGGNLKYYHSKLNGFNVYSLPEKSANSLISLLSKLDSKVIHLHYVSYGYSKRGVPFWLYLGLFKWLKKSDSILITTFHELFAKTIIPWTSSFWNQCLQRFICKKLAILSKHIITSRDSYGNKLRNYNPDCNIIIMPVFSNIGEMDCFFLNTKRERGLIVLGSGATRRSIYKNYKNQINDICHKFSIVKIIDIGPDFGNLPTFNVPLIVSGVLNSSEISYLLKHNQFGLIGAYGSKYFAKSGVFAAYTSHGTLVVSLNTNFKHNDDGIEPNKLFATLYSHNIDFNAITRAAYQWYYQHSLRKQTLIYSNILMTSLITYLKKE
jgi:hypothetical protein